jgi:tRNA(Ile)-lysidine synthase
MALAFLAKKDLKQWQNLTAFIVDHKIRSNSTEEAYQVQRNLSKLGTFFLGITAYPLTSTGIGAIILTAEPFQSTGHPGLETTARTRRYRLLGEACRHHGIDTLLLGHHCNDQYETALFRIAKYARHSLGMSRLSGNIPENEGVYGVHESGDPQDFYVEPLGVQTPPGVRGFERGGVQISRPLLSYSKSELISICRENDVQWVEDPSNQDKTLTPRNAIRHGLPQNSLPLALREQSMLNLVRKNDTRMQTYIDLAEDLFGMCRLWFNPSLGQLFLSHPLSTISNFCRNLESRKEEGLNIDLIISLLIRRLVQIVSPLQQVELSKVAKIASTWLHLSKSPEKNHFLFQAGNVHITNESSLSQYRHDFPRRNTYVEDTWVFFRPSESRNMLSDQGLLSAEGRRFLLEIPPSSTNLEFRAFKPHLTPTSTPPPFHLYDNRFWISVHNPSPFTLRIRPLLPSHLDQLLSGLQHGEVALDVSYSTSTKHTPLRTINTFRIATRNSTAWQIKSPPHSPPALLRLVPSHELKDALSWALGMKRDALTGTIIPVLEFVEPSAQASSVPGPALVLGFPTLGVRVRYRQSDVPEWVQRVEWVARYKHVDWGRHERRLLENVLVYPVKPIGKRWKGRWALGIGEDGNIAETENAKRDPREWKADKIRMAREK